MSTPGASTDGDPPPFGGLRLIADTSAWSALHRARALGIVPPEWPRAVAADQILTSPIVKLELLHSARTAAEFAEWEERLSVLREIEVPRPVCQAAIGALRELSEKSDGYHRVGLGDALIAASASLRDVGVLHYNHRDFARLREVLEFENVPVAVPGTFEQNPGQ